MKVAIVHDYLKEFGGAERVLKTLSEMYPDAPIYTAFKVKGSTADKEFAGKDIRESFLAPILKIWRLYSPLRFLTPIIWRSFNLSEYNVVITSASWYITRGFRVGPQTKVICYCHTPPRWLYGYETSVGYQKYWPVKVYAAIVGFLMRLYDKWSVKTVDYWVANSENTQKRIEKHYGQKSVVVYPPVQVGKIVSATKNLKKKDYYLIVSRLVGAKGIDEAISAASELGFDLKIVGENAHLTGVEKRFGMRGKIELLGRVSDESLYKLYGEAKAFIALARQEDFGMTVVEAMAAGTPVIAFNGGGFKESVVDGKTGVLIDGTDKGSIAKAVKKIEEIKWQKKDLHMQARKFSKKNFVMLMKGVVRNAGIARSRKY